MTEVFNWRNFVEERTGWLKNLAFVGLVLAGLAVLSQFNYLLFHAMVELFAVVVAFAIFVLVWNTHQYFSSGHLLVIGVAYFFVGAGDLVHTISYKGMGIMTTKADIATQLWIFTRYFESIALLIAAFQNNPLKISKTFLFAIMLAIFTLGVLSIFGEVFPVCYHPVTGLTAFKVVSECIIVLILLLTIRVFYRNRKAFSREVFLLIQFSLVITILAELAFTIYQDVYGIFNVTGHLLKLVSFFLLYKAIVERGLRKPVKNLFLELKEKTEALEEANKTKDAFFSIVAHDLKNPFNSIIGFTEMLNRQWDMYDEDRKKYFIEQVEKVGKSSYAMVENLLEWSRSQTGRLNLHFINIPLNSLMNEMKELYKPIALRKQVQLQVQDETEGAVYADYHTLTTALRNLVSNAIKYTAAEGTVSLYARMNEGEVQIMVQDDGMGMTEEDKQKLFRLDTKNSRRGTDNETGTGLGLILVNEFIRRNNGRLDVQSEEGKGSVFTISLPAGIRKIPDIS